MDKLVRMKMHKFLLLAVACTWAMGAAAQWQWIDKDGRKVFSDRPPPQDTPEKNILKQPGGGVPRSAPAPVAAAPAEGTPAATTTAAAGSRCRMAFTVVRTSLGLVPVAEVGLAKRAKVVSRSAMTWPVGPIRS